MAQAAQPERGAVSCFFVFEPRGMRGALGSDFNRTICDLYNHEYNPALICLVGMHQRYPVRQPD